jgi:hypothetical protein
MESLHQYIFRYRSQVERKAYHDNLVSSSNCLGTTANLFKQKPRVLAGDNLEQQKAVSRANDFNIHN